MAALALQGATFSFLALSVLVLICAPLIAVGCYMLMASKRPAN